MTTYLVTYGTRVYTVDAKNKQAAITAWMKRNAHFRPLAREVRCRRATPEDLQLLADIRADTDKVASARGWR